MQLHAQKQSVALFTVDESTNSKKSTVDDKVSDSSGRLMLMHYGEKGSITCTNKSQTVLVDFCRCTKQTSRTYFWTSFCHRKFLRFQGSQRTNKWELGCAKCEILVLFTALLFHIFTRRGVCTQKLLHTGASYTDAFTHRRFYTQKLWHTANFHTEIHRSFFTRRRFCTQNLLHTGAFPRRRFCTQKLLHTDTFTHRRFYTQTF